MTTEKIRWTTRQRDLVVAAVLNLLKSKPQLCPAENQPFTSATVKFLVEQAQFVLPDAHRKPSFSFKFLVDFAQDVTRAWQGLKLEEATREALLSNLSVDRLIAELAARQVEDVSKKVYEQLKIDLFDRFNERLSKIETALGLVPDTTFAKSGPRKSVPHFVLVGLFPEQVSNITEEFAEAATFKSVKDVGSAELKSAVTGQVVLVSSFCSHTMWNTAKALAKEAHFVKHIRDIKPLIRSRLS